MKLNTTTKVLPLFLAIILLFTACSTPTPKVSDIFKEQIMRVFEEGATLSSMTEQGVNYNDYGNQLAKVKGAYDLASATWPDGFAPDAKTALDKSFEGWGLALAMWELKVNDQRPPIEPDQNGYDDIVSYAGEENLIVQPFSSGGRSSNDGKKSLPLDENIGILLGIAGDHFEQGKIQILGELSE